MSERINNEVSENGVLEEAGIEIFDDARLGFAALPAEVRIDSPDDVARFKAEHGIELGSFLEENS